MRGWMLIAGLSLASCSAADAPQVAVPAALQFPAGEHPLLRAEATGVQIYECKTAAQPAAKPDWILQAPEASLADAKGTPIGKHYAGPSWESLDGSKVVGELRARADAPDGNGIPWLLLSAKSTSGTGVFATVKSVQRINTVGGKAPAGCGEADLGKILRVPYSATYVFSTNQ